MPLRIFITVGLLLLSLSPYAQQWERNFEVDCDPNLLCEEFDIILRNAISYLEDEDGANAYRELKALEACDKCPEHRDNLDSLSDEIIHLFQAQNKSLDSLLKEQTRTVEKLIETTQALRSERSKVDRQLAINEKMTQDALISNYLRLANKYYEQETDIGKQEARWLTDFAYHYVDSTHFEVKKMMHRLINDQLLGYYAYDPSELLDAQEEALKTIDNIIAVDWSPDGKWLAVGSDNGRLLIFDAEATPVFDVIVSNSEITDLHWNRESQQLAFVLDAYNVGFVEQEGVAEWEMSSRILSIGGDVGTVRWSPTQTDKLAVATLGTNIYLFEGTTTEPVMTMSEGHLDWIRDLAWSPDGEKIVSCDDMGVIVQWSALTGKSLFQRTGHTDYARTVDWHPDGATFLSGGDDNQLIIWTAEGEVFNRLNFEGWIYQARYSESGQYIGVVVGGDMFYQVLENDRIAIPLPPNVTRFAWRGEQNTVAPKDKMVLEGEWADFSLPAQSGLRRMEAQMVVNAAAEIGAISRLAWSPDGTKLAYVKDDKLELVTQDSLFSISLQGVTITDLAWHPGLSGVGLTSNFLATLTDDLEILIWDVASLSIVSSEEVANPGLALSWSPDGESLALVNVAGELIVYDYGQQLAQQYRQQFTNDYIRTVDWSPDGRQLALGSDDNSIVIFDWRNKQIVERLSLHTDWVRKVIWLDDAHFVSAGDDGQTLIWGNRNREGKFKRLHSLNELTGFHVSAAYHATKSGGILAVGTTDNQLGRWLLDPDFKPTFDTLLLLPTAVTDLAWRPKSEDLVFSSYSPVPQELNRYLQLQAAYESNEKPVISSDLGQILMNKKGGLASYFYLPKIRVTPNRYDQVAWSKDEQYLAYIDAESTPTPYNQLQLHDLAQEELTLTYSLEDADIAYLTISPDNRYLAVAPDSGYFMILNLNDPADSLRWPLGEADLKNWDWSADGRYLAILDRNYQVFVYDTQKRTLDPFATEIKDYDQATILFHPRRKQNLYIVNHHGIYELNTDNTDGAQLIYEAPSATNSNLPDNMVRATWIDDGQQLLYVNQGMPPTILAVEPGAAEVLHETGDANNLFAWTGTPPGRLAEIRPMDQDKTDFNGQELEYARIWNLTTGESPAILRGLRSQLVTEMALSSDGRQLATLGAALEPYQGKYNRGSLRVRIWEVESQRNIFDLPLEGTQNLSFSPQGNYLLTYFNNGQVGIWPLESSTISRYLANSDKDLYLERLSSKDNQPFLDRIEEWELGKGINFKKENFDLIKAREGAQIRRNWGEHYVDKAWLNQEGEAVAKGFDQARSLHYVENTTRIRPSTMDTLALVNIWIERTYFALANKDDQQADEALLEAQRLRPGLPRLAMLDLLLAWQEGRREGLVQALLNGKVLSIKEEYANWDRRDIHLNDEIFYLRLVALIQSRPDLVSPVEEPLMATLLADIDPLTREKLLVEYYRINASNPNLIEPGMRQTYFENAVAFLEKNWAATQADPERLQDYISYNYYLQDLELEKKKPQRASQNAANNLKAAESLLAMNPDNPDYKALYLATLAEAAMLDLRLDRTKASEVTQRLRSARQRHPDVEAPYLELQLANAQLLMGNQETAFQYYYSLLERYGLNGMQNLLKEELDAIDPALTATVKPVLEGYRIYRQARDAYWEEKPVFTLASLKTQAPDLNTADWERYAEITKGLFDATVMLNKMDMLPKDSLMQHMEAYNRSVGDRIYLLLYSGNWELVAPSLEEFRQDLPQQKWPVAVDAVLAVLEGNWSTARRLLNQVKDLPNDGIRTEEFTQMRDFLLSLPRVVRENKAFLKRWDNWRNRLE